jgi:hypothetical protein
MTNTKPMSPAEVIAGLLKDHAGAELRLRAWDGSEAGPPGAPAFEEGRMGVDQILARRPQR